MIYVIHWFVNILTLGLVSIATITTTTYHVDEPILELNNQSLNDVFDTGNLILNGDFSNGTTNWTTNGFTGTLSVVNGKLAHTLTNTQSYNGVRQSINTTLTNNDVYYIKVGSINYSINETAHRLYFFGNTIIISQSITSGVDYSLSLKYSGNYSNNVFVLYDNYNVAQTNGMVTYRDNIYVLNLTALGIDNLTKGEMDDWYDIYVQANANNGVYIESSSHLNNNIHLVDVSVMVISFAFWVWLIKFLKGVII